MNHDPHSPRKGRVAKGFASPFSYPVSRRAGRPVRGWQCGKALTRRNMKATPDEGNRDLSNVRLCLGAVAT